jgi:hypothetical protein
MTPIPPDEAECTRTQLTIAIDALSEIAGEKGQFAFPFPEQHEDYGAVVVVLARSTLDRIRGVK